MAYSHPTASAMAKKTPASHKQRIWKELKALGMSRWGFLKLETRYLPKLIHKNEPVKAIVYGHGDSGSAMLVATDRRVMWVDRKPLFTTTDELTYDIVAGITYGQVGQQATVVLHSRIGDYKVRTLNLRCAKQFREYIEERCLEHMSS